MREEMMPETTNTAACSRVGDLVAFLYGEANESETRSFQNHVSDCATCRADLSTFGEVREGIGTWKDEALAPMRVKSSDFAIAPDAVRSIPKRSALIALREFFTLSPLWLRGATAFASLLLVALLALTAVQFFQRPKSEVAKQTPPVPVMSDKNLKETAPGNIEGNEARVATVPTIDTIAPPVVKRDKDFEKSASTSKSARRGKATLSNEERSQLSELLIAEKNDEESLPGLYDLLYESN
jgi:hypothetical protein